MKMPPEVHNVPAVLRCPRTCAQGNLIAQAGENGSGTTRRIKMDETCKNGTGAAEMDEKVRPRARNG
jgi:hypothetical protein